MLLHLCTYHRHLSQHPQVLWCTTHSRNVEHRSLRTLVADTRLTGTTGLLGFSLWTHYTSLTKMTCWANKKKARLNRGNGVVRSQFKRWRCTAHQPATRIRLLCQLNSFYPSTLSQDVTATGRSVRMKPDLSQLGVAFYNGGTGWRPDWLRCTDETRTPVCHNCVARLKTRRPPLSCFYPRCPLYLTPSVQLKSTRRRLRQKGGAVRQAACLLWSCWAAVLDIPTSCRSWVSRNPSCRHKSWHRIGSENYYLVHDKKDDQEMFKLSDS